MTCAPILLLQRSDQLSIRIQNVLTGLNLSWEKVSSIDSGYKYLKSFSADICVLDPWFDDHQGPAFLQYVDESQNEIQSIVVSSHPSINDAVESMQLGAVDYLSGKEISSKLPPILSRLTQNRKSGYADNGRQDGAAGQKSNIIGKSKPFKKVTLAAQKAAQSRENVLIQGESGTGKELFARYIHYRGSEHKAAFIPVNCGAIPDNLLESELFGHVKGAFTGAETEKNGFFQAASGGTLFLDEIANTSLAMQAKLLRALENNEIWKVGSRRPDKVNVRIIAATNESLYDLVQQGTFREDLYYRLNVIGFTIPPLRERGEDILELLDFFLRKFAKARDESPRELSQNVIDILLAYDWPGNVRELENIVKRLLILSENERIIKSDLPSSVLSGRFSIHSSSMSLQEMERKHIKRVCEMNDWNISQSARQLKIGRRTLYNKLDKYNLH